MRDLRTIVDGIESGNLPQLPASCAQIQVVLLYGILQALHEIRARLPAPALQPPGEAPRVEAVTIPTPNRSTRRGR